jgi:hypothetical protein
MIIGRNIAPGHCEFRSEDGTFIALVAESGVQQILYHLGNYRQPSLPGVLHLTDSDALKRIIQEVAISWSWDRPDPARTWSQVFRDSMQAAIDREILSRLA